MNCFCNPVKIFLQSEEHRKRRKQIETLERIQKYLRRRAEKDFNPHLRKDADTLDGVIERLRIPTYSQTIKLGDKLSREAVDALVNACWQNGVGQLVINHYDREPEQTESPKPCEYCDGQCKPLPAMHGDIQGASFNYILFDANGVAFMHAAYGINIRIKFCPVCGRKLEV